MAKPIDEQDLKEWQHQVRSEPDLWHVEARAYDPRVKIKNDIYPRPHEIYNCTTCRRAEREHPAQKIKNGQSYRVKCKQFGMYCTGPRMADIGCTLWDRRESAPKHGWLPGVEI